jgi:ABC-2 type transport system ATP-binding protein
VLDRGFLDVIRNTGRRVVLTTLDGVNIKVREGEVLGLLGPNGAGKSTLIKILCTLILPSEGNAYVNGYDVVKEGQKARSSFGFVTTDEPSFYTGKAFVEESSSSSPFKRGRERRRVRGLGMKRKGY